MLLHSDPPLGDPSCRAFLASLLLFPSLPDLTQWGIQSNSEVAVGGGHGQGLWVRDCQAGRANAGLVGAQARVNCPEAK